MGDPTAMKLLLDTHVFLWALLEPERLPRTITDALRDLTNTLWLSPIVIWETLILAEKGRVVLHPDSLRWLNQALQRVPFYEAPLTMDVAIQSRLIPLPHQDPADRFLAATALVYELTLITADRRLMALDEIDVLPAR